jgi:hypothetical protein
MGGTMFPGRERALLELILGSQQARALHEPCRKRWSHPELGESSNSKPGLEFETTLDQACGRLSLSRQRQRNGLKERHQAVSRI